MVKSQSRNRLKAILCVAVLSAPVLAAALPSQETAHESRLVFGDKISFNFPKDAPPEVAEWAKNTIKIFRFTDSLDSLRIEAQGSGFFIQNPSGGNPLLVTACHVLKSSVFRSVDTHTARTKTAFFDSSGYMLKVKRVRFCSTKEDVAVLEMEGFSGKGFRLADRLQSGEPVYILGYPIPGEVSEKNPKIIYRTMSLTSGLMLFHKHAKPQFGIAPGEDDIQRDLSGSSGGPVLNGKGEVAGVYQTQTGSPFIFFHGALRADLLEENLKQEGDDREGEIQRNSGEVLGKIHFYLKVGNFPPNYLQRDNLILIQKAAESSEAGAVLLQNLKRTAKIDAVLTGVSGIGAVSAAGAYYLVRKIESGWQAAIAVGGLDWTVPLTSPWLFSFAAATGLFAGFGAVSCQRAFRIFNGLKRDGSARESLHEDNPPRKRKQ